MGKGNGVFRFKQFECRHCASSMKIGVDAVLLGAWAGNGKNAGTNGTPDVARVLDVGTGCGVIALMAAQRFASAKILAIDIHEASVEEASLNFDASPWRGRLTAQLRDFASLQVSEPLDLILSNPPYFESGIIDPSTPREQARHKAGLSPETLLAGSIALLSESGRVAMVIPYEQAARLIEAGEREGLHAVRRLDVRGHAGAPLKRTLLEFARQPSPLSESEIILETSPGIPTRDYVALCRPFYVKSPYFD